MSLNIKGKLREIAKVKCRELRQKQTPAEVAFWELVRDKRLGNYKFYRQYPVFYSHKEKESFFIADFYCHDKKLVIEIDGDMHKLQKTKDELRTRIINLLGLDVLRRSNEEIMNKKTVVKNKLIEVLNSL